MGAICNDLSANAQSQREILRYGEIRINGVDSHEAVNAPNNPSNKIKPRTLYLFDSFFRGGDK